MNMKNSKIATCADDIHMLPTSTKSEVSTKKLAALNIKNKHTNKRYAT